MARHRSSSDRDHPTVSRWAAYDVAARSDPPPDGLIVRPAEVADCAAVAAIEAARDGVDVELARRRYEVDLGDASRFVVVAVVDGEVVGFGRAGYIPRAQSDEPRPLPEGWYLLGLIVVDAWRRRGVGRALTEARLRWIAERAGVVRYFANVRNLASLRLHAQLGFVEVTHDFSGPGLSFEGGEGVLSELDLRRSSRSPTRSLAG